MEVWTMRSVLKVSAAVLLFAALAWASNPWDGKPYEQWTQKDVMQVLNNSPWAEMTKVKVTWKQPSSGRAAGRGGSGQDIIEARWVSSKVIREALVRQNVLNGKMTEQQADTVVSQKMPAYELVLFGQDLSPLDQMSDADVAKDAYIEGKETQVKEPAAQAKIERGPNGQAAAVIFAFPRTANGKPVVGPKEKELDFTFNANKMNIDLHFNTQKMTTKDGLDI
jgi:hypothetical protein